MIYTIGHSTRKQQDLLDLLREFRITLLCDVRTIPRSRFNPQFNSDELERAVTEAGIAYKHLPGLGGLRHPLRDSPNKGWKNSGFRGFADYMLTPEFEASLQDLIDLAIDQIVAIMCAEAVHWRCHRMLVSDALTVRNIEVRHIQSGGRSVIHKLTPFACVSGTQITYPPEQPSLDL
jgi:uncharacterized protein (DUF488 family)